MHLTHRMLTIVAFAAVAFLSCGSVWAQRSTGRRSDRQNYRVVVPTNLSIVSPDDVTLTHDESNANQQFPSQSWRVLGNNRTGVSVSFTATSAFTNLEDSRYKCDARLRLAINSSSGPGAWTMTQVSDVTDYANNDNTATVSAVSNGTSNARFDLGVNFVTGTYGSFPSGIYETTIVGTITAN